MGPSIVKYSVRKTQVDLVHSRSRTRWWVGGGGRSSPGSSYHHNTLLGGRSPSPPTTPLSRAPQTERTWSPRKIPSSTNLGDKSLHQFCLFSVLCCSQPQSGWLVNVLDSSHSSDNHKCCLTSHTRLQQTGLRGNELIIFPPACTWSTSRTIPGSPEGILAHPEPHKNDGLGNAQTHPLPQNPWIQRGYRAWGGHSPTLLSRPAFLWNTNLGTHINFENSVSAFKVYGEGRNIWGASRGRSRPSFAVRPGPHGRIPRCGRLPKACNSYPNINTWKSYGPSKAQMTTCFSLLSLALKWAGIDLHAWKI